MLVEKPLSNIFNGNLYIIFDYFNQNNLKQTSIENKRIVYPLLLLLLLPAPILYAHVVFAKFIFSILSPMGVEAI